MRKITGILLFLAFWSNAFIAYNFVGLYSNGGELVIRENIQWLLMAELVVSVFISAFIVGLMVHYCRRAKVI